MKKFLMLILPIFAIAPSIANASVTIGSDNADNCIPFSCSLRPNYQQVYSSTAFSSIATISSFTIFANDVDSGGTFNTSSYDIKFYLTSSPVGGLSTTLANNRGELLADFGSFSLSGKQQDETTFDGLDFVYDPSKGNLLMDVVQTSFVNDGDISGTQFQAVIRSPLTSRFDSLGLVTRFNFAAVPEPATWAMFLLGFGAVGYSMRRRKGTTAQVSFA